MKSQNYNARVLSLQDAVQIKKERERERGI